MLNEIPTPDELLDRIKIEFQPVINEIEDFILTELADQFRGFKLEIPFPSNNYYLEIMQKESIVYNAVINRFGAKNWGITIDSRENASGVYFVIIVVPNP